MSETPIIVKKKKRGGHKAHGGAWKVAYADFVTAMMAFFLLLWLLNAATKEQLEGISNYFAPITTRPESSGGGGFLAGDAAAEKGNLETRDEDAKPAPPSTDEHGFPAEEPEVDEREERQLAEAEKALRAAVGRLPNAGILAKSLLVDNTPEGLRIQIVEQEGLPMFPRGEAVMYTHTQMLLDMVAKVILEMPQAIAISGHTDALPFRGSGGYSNWELSADRANAVRRSLIGSGVPESRIARVIGKAANEPLLPGQPEAPGNRRMTVVLLRGSKPIP
ncbi:MAG TPA: flagellar motor protein MotB [Rhodospirillales bacterium]|nr:flagellar motor protein MotB [Rhodospirillales bacterium]